MAVSAFIRGLKKPIFAMHDKLISSKYFDSIVDWSLNAHFIYKGNCFLVSLLLCVAANLNVKWAW